MADCSKNFYGSKDSYINKISLDTTKKDKLRTSRNALREKIKSYLKEKGVKNPRFYMQGSYAHKTLIIPLNGDYDIDDGTYIDLIDFEKEPTTRTVHNWIVEAVEGHTQTPPKDKEPCVRAIFKDGYHVDLPIYKCEQAGDDKEKYYLAKKSAGWEESNPRAMTDWFQAQVKNNSEQLRRLVLFFKGWRDFRMDRTSKKLPSGFTLTILACEEYQSDIREDISFLETSRAIHRRLQLNEEIWKPYEPTENMRDYITDSQFRNFMKELETIIQVGDKAIAEKNQKKGAEEWQSIFGERFPVFDDPEDNESSEGEKFKSRAIIGTTFKSA
jgi:hypothetical protein